MLPMDRPRKKGQFIKKKLSQSNEAYILNDHSYSHQGNKEPEIEIEIETDKELIPHTTSSKEE